jgi:hypothetical protein
MSADSGDYFTTLEMALRPPTIPDLSGVGKNPLAPLPQRYLDCGRGGSACASSPRFSIDE